MASKKFLLGILVTVLVFGMAVIGCDNGTTSSDYSIPSNMQGAWYLDGITALRFELTSSTFTPSWNPIIHDARFRNGNIETRIAPAEWGIWRSSVSVVGDSLRKTTESIFGLGPLTSYSTRAR